MAPATMMSGAASVSRRDSRRDGIRSKRVYLWESFRKWREFGCSSALLH